MNDYKVFCEKYKLTNYFDINHWLIKLFQYFIIMSQTVTYKMVTKKWNQKFDTTCLWLIVINNTCKVFFKFNHNNY